MPEISTTKREREIMRHALGLSSKDSSYRNYFSTGPESDDYEVCQGLVEKGLMTVRKLPFCNNFLYYVTDAGKAELN
ncbi:MAG: hypothetical protein LUE17_05895 [Planctomycetaceae bacterium]|nr:hypothetical protein [Planctomycetaceae bacterium]